MLKRVIENWLANASERSFQLPFCYILSNSGFTILHLSRHCTMELGKDIIAIDPNGVPCAYQLKGGNITTKMWKKEIVQQVQDLVLGQLVHPALKSTQAHRSFLVTNGKLDEEVSRAIDDLNRGWKTRGQPQLDVIVGGQLLIDALQLGQDLWPTELKDVNLLLEFAISDGKDIFPKSKLSQLLESTLPFVKTSKNRPPSKSACNRAITSAALLTAISTMNYTNEENHVAEVEAWVMYISYVLALSEKWDLNSRYYEKEVDIALKIIMTSLTNLAFELEQRDFFVEDSALIDQPFYHIRMTWVLAFMSVLGLWRKSERKNEPLDAFISAFFNSNIKSINLWGEAAVPQLLSVYWYYRFTNSTPAPDGLLMDLITNISQNNQIDGNIPLPNPYYEANDLLPYMIDSDLEKFVQHQFRVAKHPISTSFKGNSYTLESLVQLFVRKNWKQALKMMWPDITKVCMRSFEYKNKWQFHLWHNKEGREISRYLPRRQSWPQLRETSNNSTGPDLPEKFRNYCFWALLFICVYPHRINPSIIKWLDNQISNELYQTQ